MGTSLRAGMTVEASVILPLFLMTVWIFWSFFVSLMLQIRIQSAMDEVTGILAQQSFLLNAVEEGAADDGKVHFLPAVNQILWKNAARQIVIRKVGKEALSAGHIQGGSSGLHAFGVWDKNGDIRLTLRYQLTFPGLSGSPFRLKIEQNSRRRCWTGMQSGTDPEADADGTGDPMVFITERGSVYHRDIGCRHLDLTIREISSSSVSGARSRDGSKYYPCEYCASVSASSGTVYITPEGNRYHVTRDCSGLKRTIRSVPLSEAGGRRACSNCGG